MTSQNVPTAHFEVLPEGRCKELLAGHSSGRVGWNAPDGPHILPVTYVYHSGQIVFRTSPYGVLSVLQRRTPAAFEIDEIDEEATSAWNVVVRGSAQAVTHRYDLTTLWRDGPVPWAQGERPLFIAITPRTIAGRKLRGPFAD